MSLMRLALRIAAVEALKGKTLVGDNVLDSEIGAIDLKPDGTLESDQEKRFIAVYTQAGRADFTPHQPRALHEGGTCEILFEVGITTSMLARDPETGDKDVIEGIPGTDAAFEFYLDIVDRQILDTLSAGDSAWAEIWRGLNYRVVSIERLRTDSAAQVRLAGHQIKLTVELASDPAGPAGYSPDGPFGKFMAALQASASPTHQAQAAVIANVLGTPAPEDWAATKAALGLTEQELLALGLGPLGADEDRETPEADAVTIDVDGSGETIIEGET